MMLQPHSSYQALTTLLSAAAASASSMNAQESNGSSYPPAPLLPNVNAIAVPILAAMAQSSSPNTAIAGAASAPPFAAAPVDSPLPAAAHASEAAAAPASRSVQGRFDFQLDPREARALLVIMHEILEESEAKKLKAEMGYAKAQTAYKKAQADLHQSSEEMKQFAKERENSDRLIKEKSGAIMQIEADLQKLENKDPSASSSSAAAAAAASPAAAPASRASVTNKAAQSASIPPAQTTSKKRGFEEADSSSAASAHHSNKAAAAAGDNESRPKRAVIQQSNAIKTEGTVEDNKLAEIYSPGTEVRHNKEKAIIEGFDKRTNQFTINQNGSRSKVTANDLVFEPIPNRIYLVKDPVDVYRRYYPAYILSANHPIVKEAGLRINTMKLTLKWINSSNQHNLHPTSINFYKLSGILCINEAQAAEKGLIKKEVKSRNGYSLVDNS